MAGYKKMPRLNPSAIERQLLRSMDDVVNSGRNQMSGLTQGWNHIVSYKTQRAHVVGGSAKANFTTDDDAVYYLNEGTDVRYATMSPDFLPKTSVRNFRSGAGRGGVAFIGKRRPRPGIKAREWTNVLALTMGSALAVSTNKIAAGTQGRPGVSGVRIHEYNPP